MWLSFGEDKDYLDLSMELLEPSTPMDLWLGSWPCEDNGSYKSHSSG